MESWSYLLAAALDWDPRQGKRNPADLVKQKNAHLKGIRTRMDEGVHENATFAYHSFNGLIKILDRKSKKLEFVQLRGLNQARKLLVKAGELSEYRFALAILSGKVERVDRVIAQGSVTDVSNCRLSCMR